MAFNVEKMRQMAVPRSEAAVEKAQMRKQNREWLKVSQEIALCIHSYLKESGMTQKEFAGLLQVSPAYVTRLLKGNENLTLETVCIIQNVLGIQFFVIQSPARKVATPSNIGVMPTSRSRRVRIPA